MFANAAAFQANVAGSTILTMSGFVGSSRPSPVSLPPPFAPPFPLGSGPQGPSLSELTKAPESGQSPKGSRTAAPQGSNASKPLLDTAVDAAWMSL